MSFSQVWLWVDDMGGPLGLINRRIGDGLVGYRWRAGGSNGLNMPEGYENWNRLQGQPDNGKLKGVPGDEENAPNKEGEPRIRSVALEDERETLY